jgi:hypothetical protein
VQSRTARTDASVAGNAYSTGVEALRHDQGDRIVAPGPTSSRSLWRDVLTAGFFVLTIVAAAGILLMAHRAAGSLWVVSSCIPANELAIRSRADDDNASPEWHRLSNLLKRPLRESTKWRVASGSGG